jgi:hypothetical protein
MTRQIRACIYQWWCRRQAAKAKRNAVSPRTRPPRTRQQSPQIKEKKHHLAVAVVSPARDPAAAGHRTGMILHTTRQVPITPPSHLPNNPPLPHPSLPLHNNTTRQTESQRQALISKHQTHPRITIMSYPAQSNHHNAAAQSGNRHGRVSIGGGAVAKLQKQNETPSAREHAPPAPGSSPLKSKTRSITWPLPLYPQHETPPLLVTAQE